MEAHGFVKHSLVTTPTAVVRVPENYLRFCSHPTDTYMFAHCVYFWLEDDLADRDIEAFEDGLRTLTEMDLVNDSFVGRPAGTDRDVVDNSYDYSLLLWFDDRGSQEAYQVHSTHKKFVRDCESYWTRVQVYDSVSAGL